MAEFTLQALHDEIENDPAAKGYKEAGGAWKEDNVIADLINDRTGGALVLRTQVFPREIMYGLDRAEYKALDPEDREYLAVVLCGDQALDLNEAPLFGAIAGMFPGGTTTRVNILAKIQHPGSRAEILWGEGKIVTISEIGNAANQ